MILGYILGSYVKIFLNFFFFYLFMTNVFPSKFVLLLCLGSHSTDREQNARNRSCHK